MADDFTLMPGSHAGSLCSTCTPDALSLTRLLLIAKAFLLRMYVWSSSRTYAGMRVFHPVARHHGPTCRVLCFPAAAGVFVLGHAGSLPGVSVRLDR